MMKVWLKKYLWCLLPIFAIVFMILIFGPTEIFFGNYKEFGFVYGEFGITFILAGVLLSAALALLISVLPEMMRKVVLALFTGTTLAAYIQSMFLNKGLKQLGETAEGYVPDAEKAMENAVIWAVILILAMIITYVKKENYKKIFGMISLFLLLVQVVAFGTLFLTAEKTAFEYEEGELCLNMEEQFTVSSKENMIVLLLDNLPNEWLDEAWRTYPDLLNCMNDFTYYTNADCNYHGTYPSLVHILTGTPLDMTATTNDYLKNAWDNPKTNAYYELLKEKDYKMNAFIYMPEVIAGGNSLSILEGKVDNLTREGSNPKVDKELLYKTLIKMSCYRYAPDGLKPRFNVTHGQYAGIVSYPQNEQAYANYEYYEGLETRGLTLNDECNYFKFVHLNGAHEFSNDENCQYIEGADQNTGLEVRNRHIKGIFVLIEEYLRQLKELGVYNNSTVIIMTDHGTSSSGQPIFFLKQKNEMHDTMRQSNAPISYDGFVPMIVQLLGEGHTEYGKSILEYKEGELRERKFVERGIHPAYSEVRRYDGSNNGRANVWYTYAYTGDRWCFMTQYQMVPFKTTPMVDSFY